MNHYKATETLLCTSFIRLEANRIAQESPPSFLMTEAIKEEKIYQEIKQIYDQNVLLASESLQLIADELPQMGCPNEVLKEIWGMQAKGELLETPAMQQLLEKNTFADMLGLSEETLRWMYKVADHFLRQGKAQKAVQTLYSLNLICPENGLYWLALGHSYFHLEQFDKALEAYQKSNAADPDDPRGLIWMAHTYEALGHPLTALEMVNELVELLKGEEEFSDLETYQRNLQGGRR